MPSARLVPRSSAALTPIPWIAARPWRKARFRFSFIHGSADDFVPCSMSRENYDACASEKELLVIPGATHAMSYYYRHTRLHQGRDRLFEKAHLKPKFKTLPAGRTASHAQVRRRERFILIAQAAKGEWSLFFQILHHTVQFLLHFLVTADVEFRQLLGTALEAGRCLPAHRGG